MIKNVDMFFEFKNTIPRPPMDSKKMYEQSCSNDEMTVNHWRETWIRNVKRTKERFGSFKDNGIGKLFGTNAYKPCIVVGSGPSLKNNVEHLKKVKGIPIISCLHNYHYMVDNEVPVSYYVSLDAGKVVEEEIWEGGKKTKEEYFQSTKDAKLLAFIGSDESLWNSWKGEVSLFSCPVPDDKFMEEKDKVEQFHTLVSTGGNVLGAATYIAKGILGSNPIIFLGADFCFSYTRKFHPWNSKYDANIGEAMRAVDVFGNGVLTWQSYYNFKVWFEWLAMNVPGLYINCTEGGLLGSYPEGNIQQIRQMKFEELLWMYGMHEEMRDQCEKPETSDKKVLF